MQTIINNVKCKQMCFRKRAGGVVTKSADDSSSETPTIIKVRGFEDRITSTNAGYKNYDGRTGLLIGFDLVNKAFATWEVTVPTAGLYSITTFGTGYGADYAVGVETKLAARLAIDCGLAKADVALAVHGRQDYVTHGEISELGQFELIAGTYTITLMLDIGAYSMEYMELTLVEERESIIIAKEALDYADRDNTGKYRPSGYWYITIDSGLMLGTDESNGSWASWDIDIPTAGKYTIKTWGTGKLADGVSGAGTLAGTLSVNSGEATDVLLSVHGGQDYEGFGILSTLGEFELSAGANTIKLALDAGRYTIDYLTLTLSGSAEVPFVPYKKVYADGVLVFSAEEYIYSGYGTLADGVTLSGMEEYSDNGGGLYKAVSDPGGDDDMSKATFKICGVNLSDFNTLSITNGGFGTIYDDAYALWNTAGVGGYGRIYWGIDSADTSSTLLANNTDLAWTYNEFTAEMDVSGYTGTHDIVFYAETKCNYDSGIERVALYLTEVKLCN